MTAPEREILAEARRRRTFAIISHPDAGKTTLTEKFLLYAGAVAEAGAVKARAGRRKATSDWMAMEQERGISITSTVLQFGYRDHTINLSTRQATATFPKTHFACYRLRMPRSWCSMPRKASNRKH